MNINELLALHKLLSDESRELMKVKNHDYTQGSTDPFANFRAVSAIGLDPKALLLARMLDKLQRLATSATSGLKGESRSDAVRDIINYAVLFEGLSDEEGSGETARV